MFEILFGLILAPFAVLGAVFAVALVYASLAAVVTGVAKGIKKLKPRK